MSTSSLRRCAPALFAVGLLSGALVAHGDGHRVLAKPEGTTRVRVYLPQGELGEAFRDRMVPGAPILSEREGPFVDLALTPEQREHLHDDGHRCDDLPDEAWDVQMNPTEYTFARMVSELQTLESTYPSEVALTQHPSTTHDGRTIWEVKLSDNVAVDEDEPNVFFVGVHHGGEMAGCDILMFWLNDTMANYGIDPTKTGWVDDHETRIIVIGNPDGWNNNETGLTSGWRKNNRDNNNNGQFDPGFDGVDLNRNFDFKWLCNGSGSPSSSTYRGPAPASEPEAALCQTLMAPHRPVLAVSWHMSGEVIFLPWLWNGQRVPDRPAYLQWAQQVGAAIPKQNGAGTYTAVEENRVGGFIDDYIYAELGGFCVTVEVTWSPGLGPLSAVVANNQGTFPVVYDRLDGPQVMGHVTDAFTGDPLSAKIQILEINTNELSDRISDATYGRYHWLLVPGNYNLIVSKPGYHTQQIPVTVNAGTPTVVDVNLEPYFAEYGVGLAGSGGFTPDLDGSGTPILGQAMSLDVSSGLGGAACLYVLSAAQDAQPGLGGTILVAPPWFVDTVVLGGGAGVPGAGSASLGGTVPNDPALQGLDFFTQTVVLDSGGPQGAALSEGVRAHIE